MRFFHNGIDQGIAYAGQEIPSGVYFPAVSLYMEAQVRVNFGPSFILKHDIYSANAYSEAQPMSPDDRKVRFYVIIFYLHYLARRSTKPELLIYAHLEI